jgi:hypothetical protein
MAITAYQKAIFPENSPKLSGLSSRNSTAIAEVVSAIAVLALSRPDKT